MGQRLGGRQGAEGGYGSALCSPEYTLVFDPKTPYPLCIAPLQQTRQARVGAKGTSGEEVYVVTWHCKRGKPGTLGPFLLLFGPAGA